MDIVKALLAPMNLHGKNTAEDFKELYKQNINQGPVVQSQISANPGLTP